MEVGPQRQAGLSTLAWQEQRNALAFPADFPPRWGRRQRPEKHQRQPISRFPRSRLEAGEGTLIRLGPDEPIWIVAAPTLLSTLADILFETTLRGLELQFKSGLTAAENPTIFSDKAEAEVEAHMRLGLRRRAGRAGEN